MVKQDIDDGFKELLQDRHRQLLVRLDDANKKLDYLIESQSNGWKRYGRDDGMEVSP